MSAQSRTTSSTPTDGKAHRTGKGGRRRLNRSQQQAMEIRAAASRYAQPAATEGEEATGPDLTGRVSAPQAKADVRARGRVAARPLILSKEQEYVFIGADLRRLLLTAAGLAVLMIILLFVVEH